MALLWIDGFDHYTTTSGTTFAGLEGGVYSFPKSGSQIVTMPELGGFAFFQNSTFGQSAASLVKALDTSYTSGRVGVGFHVYKTSLGDKTRGLVSFATAGGALLYTVGWTMGDDRLHLYAGESNTSIANSGSNTLLVNTLAHIEFVIDIDVTGSLEVRVDGETWISHSLNTSAAEVGSINIDRGMSGTSFWKIYVKNLYIWDDTGTTNNDWLGERNVFTLYPDGDSVDQDWVPSTGVDGYAMIDEVPADDDTTYVESTTAGDVSNFTVENLPSSNIQILGVQTMVKAAKTGTDVASVSIGPQGDPSSAIGQTQDQYTYSSHISEVNPSTTLAWTAGDINSLIIELTRID